MMACLAQRVLCLGHIAERIVQTSGCQAIGVCDRQQLVEAVLCDGCRHRNCCSGQAGNGQNTRKHFRIERAIRRLKEKSVNRDRFEPCGMLAGRL